MYNIVIKKKQQYIVTDTLVGSSVLVETWSQANALREWISYAHGNEAGTYADGMRQGQIKITPIRKVEVR